MTKFVLCHHAERADRSAGKESERYPGITIKGEEQAREKTKMLAKMICGLPGGSVIVLGGCSKAIRTKSTLMVFTDELRRTLGSEKDIIFSKPFDSSLNTLKEISMRIGYIGNGEARAIIDFPLPMEQFISLRGQKESAVARRMVDGLNGQVGFFRRFFPRSPMVLVNNVHAPETDALISFLQKRNNDTLANIVNFM
ncbi:MAG: hypothetical protein Q7S78_01660 [Candidatus Azambacteria bacterium]|nr:hypothetical protein [Candidatus Azambacteria bacterium]